MPLRLYNTLTQSKEPFQTVEPGKVGMYVCGPTVYSNSHVGHMVGPVIFDTIKRYLAYLGFDVTWVVNITDVDDKLIVQAQKEGTSVGELAERITADYLACLGADGKAVEHVAGQRHQAQAQAVAGGTFGLLQQPAAFQRRHQPRCGAAVHAQCLRGIAHADDRAVLVEQLQDRDRTLDGLASRDLFHALILRISCIICTLRAR